jgi:GNAT superfamily N-acetyltransferase
VIVHALDVQSFTPADLDEAGVLLATRHRMHRTACPALDPSYEDPAIARRAIEELLAGSPVAGATARRDGRLVGYLVGTRVSETVWGPDAWVEGAGCAAEDAETILDLYAQAATGWLEAGLSAHYAVVPATDREQVDAWFRLGFGQQHVYALRASPDEGEIPPPPAAIRIRPALLADLDALARLDLVLPEHQALAPTFSRLAIPTVEEARSEWEEGWDDPRFVTFVAEHAGRVIGCAVGCPVDASSMHRGVTRPPGAGLLGFAAVLPEARGIGAGRALGEAVLEWARTAGLATVVVDWRSTNLLSSRTWSRLGFRPTFLRLHRLVA